MIFVLSGFEEALLFFPLVLGVYISYSVVRLTDMTPDGSFVLGAAVLSRVLVEFDNPILGVLAAVSAGGLAGVGVAFIQRHDKIDPLVAGILALFMLYSVNFHIMGIPNINLLHSETLLKIFDRLNINQWVIVGVLALNVSILIMLFLYTRVGLLLRGFGSNKALLKKLGHDPENYRILGLVFGNSLAALCGAMTAQVDGYADLNMGFGVTLTGIGSVIIGLHLVKSIFANIPNFLFLLRDVIGCFLGAFVYFVILNLFLYIDIDPINLKLFLGLILVLFLRTAKRVECANG